jgi:2-aminophenol/2-amino-5-chlorophenol 1,6-dioxygenase beta subunit
LTHQVFRLPTPSSRFGEPSVVAVGNGERGDQGSILAGFLAPHPPHLVYADNPEANEPRSEGGWEQLRWAYQEIRRRIREELKPDVILVHAPHWITMIGHHVNCVPNPRGFSVEPIFPDLLRFHYDFKTDVQLAEAVFEEARADGLVARRMDHPGVRIDYATIGSLYLLNPEGDIPVVSLSCNNNPYFYSHEGLEEMEQLGVATRRAIERSGRRAVLAASNSLSHIHFDETPSPPEDMSKEHPMTFDAYKWDMRILEMLRRGRTREVRALLPSYIEATEAEVKGGALSWMLAAMDWPEVPARVLAYQTVIGTGNAVAEWPAAAAGNGNGVSRG